MRSFAIGSFMSILLAWLAGCHAPTPAHVAGSSSPIVGTWAQDSVLANGPVSITFEAEGTFTLSLHDGHGDAVRGVYELRGGFVMLTAPRGESVCPGITAVYACVVANDAVQFFAVSDECEARRASLSRLWRRL